MRHQVRGRKLNRTKSHRDAMFHNMATSLFEHKRLHTTEAKAKELRPFAESLITKAKNALAREKQNLLPEGQTVDIHNRRLVGRFIRNKAVLQELFDAIAPVVEARNGGYTRITKVGLRRGDACMTAIIELVDWSAPKDGSASTKRKKKASKKKATAEAKKVATVETAKVVEETATVEQANEAEASTVETVTEEVVVASADENQDIEAADVDSESEISTEENSNSEEETKS